MLSKTYDINHYALFWLISFMLIQQLKSRQSQLLWLIWVQHLVCTNPFLLLLKGHFIWRKQEESKKKNRNALMLSPSHCLLFKGLLSIKIAFCHCHLLDSMTYIIVFLQWKFDYCYKSYFPRKIMYVWPMCYKVAHFFPIEHFFFKKTI